MEVPLPLRFLWKGWMAFSHALGMVMSTVILTVLWIVGFGIYAMVMKLIMLPKRFKKAPDSHWIVVKPDPIENMRYPF